MSATEQRVITDRDEGKSHGTSAMNSHPGAASTDYDHSSTSNPSNNDNDRLEVVSFDEDGGGDGGGDADGSDREDEKRQLTRYTLLYAGCAAVNSCNLGYDIGISTTAGRLVQQDLNLTNPQREILIGSMNFWASTYNNIIICAVDLTHEDGVCVGKSWMVSLTLVCLLSLSTLHVDFDVST